MLAAHASKKALLIIDLQNDFGSSGRLPIKGVEKLIPIANQLKGLFECVIYTQDWHPENHCSFVEMHPGAKIGDKVIVANNQQELWPMHCVAHTEGAAFLDGLLVEDAKIIYKGIDVEIDSYSAFFDNGHLRSTGLAEHLQAQGITDLYLMGVVTEYCIKYSALDAINLGFNVYLIGDACCGLDQAAIALETMRLAGVQFVGVEDVV